MQDTALETYRQLVLQEYGDLVDVGWLLSCPEITFRAVAVELVIDCDYSSDLFCITHTVLKALRGGLDWKTALQEALTKIPQGD